MNQERLSAASQALKYQKQWFASVQDAANAGEPIALVNADAPHEIFRTLGIPYVVNQWWASIIAAKRAGPAALEHVASRGFPDFSQQYDVLPLGEQFLATQGRPWGGLPTPRFDVAERSGDVTQKIFEQWGTLEGVETYLLSRTGADPAPDAWWELVPRDWEQVFGTNRLDLLQTELQELIAWLEDRTGRSFDHQRFQQIMDLANEQAEWNRRTRDLIAQTRPTPVLVNDTMPAVMIPQWHRGTHWAVDAARCLYEEVLSRVEWFGLLLRLRMLHGAAFGVASTALTTGVIEMIPLGRLSEGLGYFSLSGTIAHTIGPLLAIQLSVRASSLWVFGVATFCALIALFVALKLSLTERPPTCQERRRWKTLSFHEMLDSKVLPVVVLVLISSLSYSVIITYLPPYLVGLQLADVASIFFSVWAASTLIVRVIAGRIQDRYGENAVVPVALCLMATGIGLLAVAESFWSFMIAAIVGGLGHGAVAPSLQAVGIKRTTPDRLATATSTHYLGLDAGLAIGPLLLGFLISTTGYTGLYLVAAVILLLNLIVYWGVHGRGVGRQIPNERPTEF